ncbi:MAG: DUF1849 family protein [Alphaproteobacteria bacterium]
MRAATATILVFLCLSAHGGVVLAATLAPHRASYTLEPGGARPGSDIIRADGRMWVEVGKSCDGWLSSQRIKMAAFPREGAAINTDTAYTSWESFDGLQFRFATQTNRDGRAAERRAGHATLERPGGPGQVILTAPEKGTVDLSAGTVFPTRHLLEILDMAGAGKRQFSRTVFDGSTPQGSSDTSVLVLSHIPPGKVPDSGLGLPDIGRWNVQIAFYDPDNRNGAPDYEMSVRLFENGVAEAMVLDFGNFTVRASLEEFEFLPEPAC